MFGVRPVSPFVGTPTLQTSTGRERLTSRSGSCPVAAAVARHHRPPGRDGGATRAARVVAARAVRGRAGHQPSLVSTCDGVAATLRPRAKAFGDEDRELLRRVAVVSRSSTRRSRSSSRVVRLRVSGRPGSSMAPSASPFGTRLKCTCAAPISAGPTGKRLPGHAPPPRREGQRPQSHDAESDRRSPHPLGRLR